MNALKDLRSKIDPRRLGALLERHAAGARHGVSEGQQTPSPWAIAVAVLALLGFGVLVGTTVSPAQSSPSAILLPSSPATQTATRQASATAPAQAKPEPTPSASSPESSGEGSEKSGEEGEESEEGATAKSKSKKNARANGKSEAGGAKRKGRGGSGSPQGSGPSKRKNGEAGGSAPVPGSLPPIEHVFLIVLSDEGYQATFGAGGNAPYFSQTLPKEGELIESYYAVAAGEPANGIALIGGQGPTPQTVSECPLYAALSPGSAGPEGQALGSGCVYPSTTLTLADQLASAGKTWKAYIEGIDAGGPGAPTSCRHPQVGETDPSSMPSGTPSGTDPYETWRNPFVYFHSLIDGQSCAKDDVGIGALEQDLSSASKTPTLAYIAPDACDDGSPAPCAPGVPGGLAPAEGFLRKVVGEIEKSAAYKEGGLIAITFDHAPQAGPGADSSGCCLNVSYPNMPGSSTGAGAPAGAATPTGGGKVGLVLISRYVKPGTLNLLGEYDHFSLLLTIEKLFGLKPLGYAGAKGLLAFDSSVFNAYG